jgi:hypothetical protein
MSGVAVVVILPRTHLVEGKLVALSHLALVEGNIRHIVAVLS